MPIVNLDIVPELMRGDRDKQYQQIAEGITEAIVASTGAPSESVHVLINEVSYARYAVGGVMLHNKSDQIDPATAHSQEH
ncbi:2-hydroxymuconate tautomerase [Nocardioides sp. NPDC126508]